MGTASKDIIIRLQDVWKCYGLGPTFRERWQFQWWKQKESSKATQWALKDINLTLRRGQNLGVIGTNGAGKSTLLKILAGVTPVTRGVRELHGRVFPMIELNAGMHPELTGRQNFYMLGAIMGLTRIEIKNLLPEIEAFSELGPFLDQPIRTYSSGMMARLGFSIAINIQSDILLIDEVLAVGDFIFQKKCLERMNSLINQGVTMILVSHNPYLIERTCDEAILLDHGMIVEAGNANKVAYSYFEKANLATQAGHESTPNLDLNRPGSGQIRVTHVQILNEAGYEIEVVETDRPVTFRLHVRVFERLVEPSISIRIFNSSNVMVSCLSMGADRQHIVFEEDGYFDCYIPNLSFMPSLYYLQIKITVEVLVDMVENTGRFKVNAASEIIDQTGNLGMTYLKASWHFPQRRMPHAGSARSETPEDIICRTG